MGASYLFCRREILEKEVARIALIAHRHINNKRKVQYYSSIVRAWPTTWDLPPEHYRSVYREAHRRRQMGHDVNVDHVVPLSSPLVCGLHVPWNLEIIPRLANAKKSNKWWPGAPFEQPDLFDEFTEQFSLL